MHKAPQPIFFPDFDETYFFTSIIGNQTCTNNSYLFLLKSPSWVNSYIYFRSGAEKLEGQFQELSIGNCKRVRANPLVLRVQLTIEPVIFCLLSPPFTLLSVPVCSLIEPPLQQ